MNNRQKEVQQIYLNNEKQVLNDLKEIYEDALADINERIANLLGRSDADLPTVIYQVDYQNALKGQIEGILETMNSNQFTTISDYLTKSYTDGFIGAMYDMQGQGVPLIIPLDQELIVQAVQHDTRLSKPLYQALGVDVNALKKTISSEVSRGIASGKMYGEIATQISKQAGITRNKALRIARTEGHRIQNAATYDAQEKAKEKGADVVKQWDSTLDGLTRDTHRMLDGQIREIDEPFSVDGMEAMFPGDFGVPGEDINCRCALLQRARWALDDDLTKAVRYDDGTVLETIKAKDYEQFKKDYYSKLDAEKLRVQQGSQKISEKRKTAEGIFDTWNNSKSDSIRPHSIMNNLKKSKIGTELLEYLEKDNVPVILCYGMDNPKNLAGMYDPFDDTIYLFGDITKTIDETSSTLVHEAMHRKLGSKGTFEEEVKCYEAEVIHTKGELTESDKKAIIKHIKENYPDLE